jgi:quercetin dioxygenase-like cupin family protein
MTATNPKHIAPSEGRKLSLFQVGFDYKVVHEDSGGELSILEVAIPPKTLVKPHVHTRETEFSIILDGVVGVRIGDTVLEAEAGSYLVKPRGIPHAMWNATSEPARIAEMVTPSGLEDYFDELAPVLSRHEPPDVYYGLAEKYGLTIVDEWIPELEEAYGIKL